MKTFLALSPTLGGDPYTVTTQPQRRTPSTVFFDRQRLRTRGVGLTLNTDVNDAISLKSITSYREYDFNPGGAGEGPANLAGRIGTTLTSSTVRSLAGVFSTAPRATHQQQISEELQLLDSLGDFKYVLGAFYFNERGREATYTNSVVVRPGGQFAVAATSLSAYRIMNESIAGFGQVSWIPSALNQKREVTGGLRYTEDDKNLDQFSTVARKGELKSHDLSMLGSVSYRWTDRVMTYARYATGYRAGGFNTRAAAGIPFVYTPEKVKTYEAGFKADFLDRRLRLNGSAFYSDYRDLQVSQFVPFTGSNAINAQAHYTGFDLEAEAAPKEGLRLSTSVGYVDPKFDVLIRSAPATGIAGTGCNPGPTPTSLDCAPSGKFTYMSKTTANAAIDYTFAQSSYDRWSARLDWIYESKRYFSTTNLPNVSPFADQIGGKPNGLLNGRVTLSDIRINGSAGAQLSVYGENLTNETYITSAVDLGTIGFAQEFFSRKRTFGIDAKIQF